MGVYSASSGAVAVALVLPAFWVPAGWGSRCGTHVFLGWVWSLCGERLLGAGRVLPGRCPAVVPGVWGVQMDRVPGAVGLVKTGCPGPGMSVTSIVRLRGAGRSNPVWRVVRRDEGDLVGPVSSGRREFRGPGFPGRPWRP